MTTTRAAEASPRAATPAAREMQPHALQAAELLKALANEQRLMILCHLLKGSLSVGQLNERVPLSQSALSQHLAVLREPGSCALSAQHRASGTRSRQGSSGA